MTVRARQGRGQISEISKRNTCTGQATTCKKQTKQITPATQDNASTRGSPEALASRARRSEGRRQTVDPKVTKSPCHPPSGNPSPSATPKTIQYPSSAQMRPLDSTAPGLSAAIASWRHDNGSFQALLAESLKPAHHVHVILVQLLVHQGLHLRVVAVPVTPDIASAERLNRFASGCKYEINQFAARNNRHPPWWI